MRGVITERDWGVVDKNFPGVHRFYLHLIRKPRTFLELLELCHSFDDTGLNPGKKSAKEARRKKQ